MSAILIESQYIGSCTYWHCLLQATSIVIDQEEHYVRRSFRNRAHILGANGLLRLSIPLERGKHQHSKMKDVKISYQENWQALHWHSITSCYRRSPYFEYYEDYFKPFYTEKQELLLDYNLSFMQTIASLLKIKLPISKSDKYYTSADFIGIDARSYFLPTKNITIDFPTYPQVFNDRFPFVKDLSLLDVLFNVGPNTSNYISSLPFKF